MFKKKKKKNNRKENDSCRKVYRDRNQPICMLQGTRELQIENYGSLGSFTEEKIILLWKKGKITIEGEHLLIDYYTDIDMKITGRIRKIEL